MHYTPRLLSLYKKINSEVKVLGNFVFLQKSINSQRRLKFKSILLVHAFCNIFLKQKSHRVWETFMYGTNTGK